jgi:ubiquinone/menaquinone biosynthesis C-methylase UbiE
MSVNDKTKKNNGGDIELKYFYSSSQNYLKRLEKHDDKSFAQYIELCKAKISPRASILDCGCGIGTSSYLLTEEGFKVTAVDLSPLFISEAEKKYGNQPNLDFFIEDASKMHFPSQSFDAVCSFDLLEHVTDVKSVLREMGRVVKAGGVLIIMLPNHLDPFEHLRACVRWKTKDRYKPWEAKSKVGAFFNFIRSSYLSITKAIGVNKRIYYLKPVLSDDENTCGADFDATWLTNWFDIENILKEIDFSIECVFPQNSGDKAMWTMRVLKLPKVIQSFYTKVRRTCVIVGIKK